MSIWFRPEELNYFDLINSEVPKLVAPTARYFIKVLQPTTSDGRFEKQVLYGEQKINWKFAGPLVLPIMTENPQEPKEFEENRGGTKNMQATVYISRKNFEDSVPEELANVIIAARGALIPEAGDVVQLWSTHNGDVAFWDVDDIERDAYLGALPLHVQWRVTLQRRTQYEPERALGQDLAQAEPIVILSPDEFEQIHRVGKVAPTSPDQGKFPNPNPNRTPRLYS